MRPRKSGENRESALATQLFNGWPKGHDIGNYGLQTTAPTAYQGVSEETNDLSTTSRRRTARSCACKSKAW